MANEIGGISVKLTADVDASGTVTGMAQIEQASERIQEEFKKTETVAKTSNAAVTKSTANAATASTKATSAFKMQKGSMAQLGQQIQDVAVMSQFGADKFIILGTQGSQIASLFGPGGAVFGAVLAISAAIGGTLVKSINAAKDAATDLPKELMDRLEEIKGRFEEVDEASRGAFLGVEFGKLNQEYEELSEKIKTTEQRILEQSAAFNGNGNAVTTSLERLEKLKQEQKDLAQVMENLNRVATADLGQQEIDLSVDGGDTGIQSRVEDIQAGLQREQELYETWRQTKLAITQGIITDEQAALIQADVLEQQRINASFDRTKARLEEERALLLENQTLSAEEKAARQAEIDAAEIAADKLKQDQLSQQAVEYAKSTADQVVNIEQKAQDAITAMKNAAYSNAIGLLDQFAGESKAAAVASIALSKGLAIAQTIQNTGVAVMKAMSVDPTGALAARASALGSANVAMIAATGLAQAAGAMSGSSSASTYSNGVPATNTTSSSSTATGGVSKTYSLNFTGNEPVNAQELADILNEAAADGVVFKFGS